MAGGGGGKWGTDRNLRLVRKREGNCNLRIQLGNK